MIKIVIVFLLILSGCENKNVFNKNFSFTPEVFESIESICKKNGGIKFLELTLNDYGYFQCKNQGYLKIHSNKKIENILNKKEKTFIFSNEKIIDCQQKCDKKRFEIELVRNEPSCLCK